MLPEGFPFHQFNLQTMKSGSVFGHHDKMANTLNTVRKKQERHNATNMEHVSQTGVKYIIL